MLLGSGGVIALVIGFWAALWAARNTPGRDWRQWYPEAAALLGGAWGASILSAHTVLARGVVTWARAPEAAQATVLEIALSQSARPFLGAVVATVLVATTIVAAGRNAPSRPARPNAPSLDRGLSIAIAVITVVGCIGWVALRGLVQSATVDLDTALQNAVELRALVRFGVLCTVALWALAVAIGIRSTQSYRNPDSASSSPS